MIDGVMDKIAGAHSELVVKVYGEDFRETRRIAEEITRALGTVKGAVDLDIDQEPPLPQLQIIMNRDAIARYGLNGNHSSADYGQSTAEAISNRLDLGEIWHAAGDDGRGFTKQKRAIARKLVQWLFWYAVTDPPRCRPRRGWWGRGPDRLYRHRGAP